MATVQDKNRIHILQLDENPMSFYLNDSSETATDAFAYGSEVKAIANTSQAFGKETQAGCMGYQIEYITYDEKADTGAIYLTRKTEAIVPKNFIEGTSSGETDYFYSGYSIPKDEYGNKTDNLICHVQSNGYYQWPYIEITAISGEVENGGVLTYKTSSIQSGKQYWAQTHTDGRVPQPFILYCADYPMAGVIPVGNNSSAQGAQTIACADESHAEGCLTKAVGRYAHAEGGGTQAGYAAHSEGYLTKAKGFYSHAEGEGTIATLNGQHVQGKYNIEDTDKKYAHIVGWGSKTQRKNIHTLDTKGNAWFGGKVKATKFESESGELTTKNYVDDEIKKIDTSSYLQAKDAIGKKDVGTGNEIFNYTDKNLNVASGSYSHAEGRETEASGLHGSHAEGYDTHAAGTHGSHAEGNQTLAKGSASHAEGLKAKAYGKSSHSEGQQTIAHGLSQHVQGEYNIEDTVSSEDSRGTYAHIVGNGTSTTRSNAHTLDWDGNAWFAGEISSEGNIHSKGRIITATNLHTAKAPGIDTPGQVGDFRVCIENIAPTQNIDFQIHNIETSSGANVWSPSYTLTKTNQLRISFTCSDIIYPGSKIKITNEDAWLTTVSFDINFLKTIAFSGSTLSAELEINQILHPNVVYYIVFNNLQIQGYDKADFNKGIQIKCTPTNEKQQFASLYICTDINNNTYTWKKISNII